MRSFERLSASTEVARRRAESAGVVGPSWWVIEAIIGHHSCYQRVATLNRVAAIWDRESMAGAVVDRLIVGGWLKVWTIEGLPALVTLTEWAAETLGLELTYPEEEQADADPYWSAPELCPKGFIAEADWGQLRRSPTAWERIALTLACGYMDIDHIEVVKMDPDQVVKIRRFHQEAQRQALQKAAALKRRERAVG